VLQRVLKVFVFGTCKCCQVHQQEIPGRFWVETCSNCSSFRVEHSASNAAPNLTETATHFQPEFPVATKGALPTGLGNKGRVGEGKAVYALALHSKAVAMTSIPAYNAAAATELSVGGATSICAVFRTHAVYASLCSSF